MSYKYYYNDNRRKWFVFVFIIFILVIGLLVVLPKAKKNVMQTVTPSRKVYLGFWTGRFLNPTTNTIDPQALKNIEAAIGKKVAIANYYRGWEYLDQKVIINDFTTISANGWTPMLSTNPYFFSECQANGMTLYKAIAAGNCDAFLIKVGNNLQQYKKPFFLRFAWEMNVDSMQWSVAKTGDSPQDYINAWRRFHTILSEEGVTNAIWVFSPQVETPTTTDISLLYPGDAYVDWVGLDGYNWGTTQSWSQWQDFKTIFYPSYLKLRIIAPTKKLMIAETNTTDQGGNQADWYKSMLSDEIPNDFPNVDAVVFFNEDKTSTEGVKWLINNSPASLTEFKTGILAPLYTSSF